LSKRLIELCTLLLLQPKPLKVIFDSLNILKLHSSVTLFAEVATATRVFDEMIEQFFSNQKDSRTLEILAKMNR